jgi:hypothetical protein
MGASANTSVSDTFRTHAVVFSLITFQPSLRWRRNTTSSGAFAGSRSNSPISTHSSLSFALGGSSRYTKDGGTRAAPIKAHNPYIQATKNRLVVRLSLACMLQ